MSLDYPLGAEHLHGHMQILGLFKDAHALNRVARSTNKVFQFRRLVRNLGFSQIVC